METDVGRKQGSSSWHIAIMGGNGCQVGKQGSSSWHIATIGGNGCQVGKQGSSSWHIATIGGNGCQVLKTGKFIMAYSYNGWKRMSVGNREVHHGI